MCIRDSNNLLDVFSGDSKLRQSASGAVCSGAWWDGLLFSQLSLHGQLTVLCIVLYFADNCRKQNSFANCLLYLKGVCSFSGNDLVAVRNCWWPSLHCRWCSAMEQFTTGHCRVQHTVTVPPLTEKFLFNQSYPSVLLSWLTLLSVVLAVFFTYRPR